MRSDGSAGEVPLDPSLRGSSTHVRRGRGGTAIAVLIFLVIAAGLYAFAWNRESAGFLSDDAVYLLMADGFSPFGTGQPALTAYVLREALFPPLYPLLLALLGAGSGTLLWAHLITTTTLVVALGIYGLWINSQLRDLVPAIGLVAIFALAPGTLLMDLELLSEFPYLMFTLVALWLAERARINDRGHAWIALCVGLATLTRTAGLSLLVAFALWLFRHRVRGRAKWLTLALIPSIAWLCYKKWVLATKGAYTTFWSSLWQQSLADPGYAVSFLENQSKALWQALLNTLDLQPSHLTQFMLAATLLAGLPVWIRRLRLCHLDAWYLLIGGTMVLLYPFPGYFARLFLPWVPIVLFYAYQGVLGITAGWGEVRGKPALAYLYLAALLLTLMPSVGFISHRLAEPIAPELANWKHSRYWFRLQDINSIREDVRFRQELIFATRQVAQWVPEGDCVYGVHTGISMLYSRRVFYQPPAPDVDDSEFESLSQGCRYFFLVPVAGQIGNHPVNAFYPSDRLAQDRTELIQTWKDPREAGAQTAVLLRSKASP